MTNPEQTPVGALLSREIKRSGLSQREVARLANLSEGRLRQIVSGYASVGHGQRVSVHAPAVTVARIAMALGITPSELSLVDRDASDELHNLTARSIHDWSDEELERESRRAMPAYQLTDKELVEELATRLAERLRHDTATKEGGSDARTVEAEKSGDLEEVTETVDFQGVELPQQVPDQ